MKNSDDRALVRVVRESPGGYLLLMTFTDRALRLTHYPIVLANKWDSRWQWGRPGRALANHFAVAEYGAEDPRCWAENQRS